MKPIIFLSILTLIIINQSCAQDLSSRIYGTWKNTDELDCPDFIDFNSNGKYQVMNDCGSQQPGLPVIENGNWHINQEKNVLELTNRSYISKNSIFNEYHGTGEKLIFFIKEVSEDEIVLCFYKDDNECVDEKYAKVDLIE